MNSLKYILIFGLLAANVVSKCNANVLGAFTSRKHIFLDNSAGQCGTTVEAVSGIVYSHAEKALPVGQGDYDNNADCTITLSAPDGKFLTVTDLQTSDSRVPRI